MKLLFAQYYPSRMPRLGGLPTDFKAKLWQGFAKIDLNNLQSDAYIKFLRNLSKTEIELIGHVAPKYHTMRRDDENKFKVGTPVEFFDEDGNMIAPALACVRTQKVSITWLKKGGNWRTDTIVTIDDRILQNWEIRAVSRSDGFDSPEDFFEWHPNDYKGKIIHWTTIKY